MHLFCIRIAAAAYQVACNPSARGFTKASATVEMWKNVQWATAGQSFVSPAVKLHHKADNIFLPAIMTIIQTFNILILFNEKYTYLQIVDIFSYGFKKYSTIEE